WAICLAYSMFAFFSTVLWIIFKKQWLNVTVGYSFVLLLCFNGMSVTFYEYRLKSAMQMRGNGLPHQCTALVRNDVWALLFLRHCEPFRRMVWQSVLLRTKADHHITFYADGL
ncbi:MAG: hypothetical protein RR216_07805, partial [Pseudoflavonifractor sp.]